MDIRVRSEGTLRRSIIEDHEPIHGLVSLREILARSSNIGASRLALRLGAARQRAYLEQLGLTQAARLEVGFNEAPLAPQARGRRDVAGLGFGYGLAATPAALAGAYTVFANQGAIVAPTLIARAPDAQIERRQVFSPEVTRALAAGPGTRHRALSSLTAREAEIAELVAQGRTNTEIADELGLSIFTVKNHVSNVLGKLGLASRREVAAWAAEHGLRADTA